MSYTFRAGNHQRELLWVIVLDELRARRGEPLDAATITQLVDRCAEVAELVDAAIEKRDHLNQRPSEVLLQHVTNTPASKTTRTP